MQVPDFLKDDQGLVIFNIEADLANDVMKEQEQTISLRLMLGELIGKGMGFVIMAPSKQAQVIRERFPDEVNSRIWLIETVSPHNLRIVNKANPDQVYVWISTCSQANLISAIGEHKAVLVGYAQGQTRVDTSVQKYTCHKVNEFVVGTSSRLNGDLSTLSVGLLQTMLDVQ